MFTLHPTLKADTVELTDMTLCRVLLMNDSTYPWLILVPKRPGISELHQLTEQDQSTLMKEISQAGQVLTVLYTPDKLNTAALGNIVPQLHIHVVARFKNDPAWPAPIWGKTPLKPYAGEALRHTVNRITSALSRE